MAIKDLNNKKTGDKLYASEWNDVMNEILAHFKNKRIHEDIVVTTGNENLLIYKDTNDVEHQFVLYPKEGTTYGELFILSVNSSQLDEYNVYYINNISSEENTIDFEISYSRAVNIDGRTDHYETTGATITALELPQGLSVVGTPTDSTISIKIPENQEYSTKNYQFTIKVSMDPEHENAQNTKTFTVNLTQNAKNDYYDKPYISEIIVNNREILPETIPSAETKINIELIIKQRHNGQDELVTEFEELKYQDYEGNWHNLETPVIQEITVPANTLTREKDRSLNIRIVAHGESLENEKISLTQIADEINYYDEIIIENFSYENLSYEANSYKFPSISYKQQVIWKSGNTSYTYDGLSVRGYSDNISDPNVSVDPNSGRVQKTTQGSTQEITLGTVTVTVDGNNNKSKTGQATVKQSGIPVYAIYAGFVQYTSGMSGSDVISQLTGYSAGNNEYEITCNQDNSVFFLYSQDLAKSNITNLQYDFGWGSYQDFDTLDRYNTFDTQLYSINYYAFCDQNVTNQSGHKVKFKVINNE